MSSLSTKLADAAAKLGKADDPDFIEKAASVAKYEAEASKLHQETVNLRNSLRSETSRFYVSVIAPLVSALAIAASAAFQVSQMRSIADVQSKTVDIQNETMRIQEQGREDTAWREVVNHVSSHGIGAAAGTAELVSFMKAGEHRTEAREFAVALLGSVVEDDEFYMLWNAALDTAAEPTRFSFALRVNRQLRSAYFDVDAKQKTQKAMLAKSKSRPFFPYGDAGDFDFIKSQFDQHAQFVGKYLVEQLKKTGSPNARLPLNGVALWNLDLSNANLSHADLTRASIDAVELSGADLGGVTDFTFSNWYRTAWWTAARISPPLLAYLEATYPYRKNVAYASWNDGEKSYRARLAALHSVASSSLPTPELAARDRGKH